MGWWNLAQRAIAAVGLVVTAPLLAALALVVRLDSPGSPVYRAQRVGMGGQPIVIHKLRTMRSEVLLARGRAITGRDDPRVTRVGMLLRRTRLDELPQLWDVTRGVLALVGPRPEAPEFVDTADPRWMEILSVRPGITGRTQLRYLHESRWLGGNEPERTYRDDLLPAKIQSDLEYVRNRSLWGDPGLIVETVRGVLGRNGGSAP